MSNIPSDEEFERASKKMEKEAHGLDQVCRNAKIHFRNKCPLVNIYLLPQGDVNFRAYIFFEKNKDIETCKNNGITQEITDFIYQNLERVGRGNKCNITVAFEFDSDENVKQNYEGNYYLRLL